MTQLTTSNKTCAEIASLLAARGVKDVVVSPGSRNTPLSVAVSRAGCFTVDVVIDERTAGFVALGRALITGSPVAVMCTSGTALLNLAPAVAEAYYRCVPLIVISADRPAEWIDQDDSQTIRQFRILDNIVKHSYSLPAMAETYNLKWFVNRTINDAIDMSDTYPCGPVHLNVQIDEPLSALVPVDSEPVRAIEVVSAAGELDLSRARDLASTLSSRGNVLIIAGFGEPSDSLNNHLSRLATLPNVVVMTEAQSNIHLAASSHAVAAIDAVLTAMTDSERTQMLPATVITFGGAILSRMVKQWLRPRQGTRRINHWHVGISDNAIDCFQSLERRIMMRPEVFFHALVKAASTLCANSDYGDKWMHYNALASIAKNDFCERQQWCDLTAMKLIMQSVPRGCNLQLSNGTVVRYAQLFPYAHIHRIDCNRGVSGIDGSTSTAIGASKAYSGLTLFITGDMSAQYDMGALAIPNIPPRFRMIVLNNGGGGIFRFIKSTSSLAELDRFFVADVRLPLRQLAEGYGFRYFEVTSEADFAAMVDDFYNVDATIPAIMNVITPGSESAEILRDYFHQKIIINKPS